jgi:hypothetical protein
MAYEIHLFTRGEGPLKTTQDLFQRAEVFLQHGVLLYGIIKEFLAQVPNGYLKDELVLLLKKVPYNFKQLKNRLKQVTFGKAATFNKVNERFTFCFSLIYCKNFQFLGRLCDTRNS